MVLRISSFAGETPRTRARLIPQNYAQLAQNTRLLDGALVPIRRGRHDWSFPATVETIYHHRGQWLGWNARTEVAPAPIAEDRLYVTGDGAPKILVAGPDYSVDTFPLALTAPTAALTASITETVDTDLSATILYTWTWVTDMDEESQPAPVSNELLWSPGITVTVTGFVAPPAGRAITRMRIYRSQTSALGETNFFFIAERAADAIGVFEDRVEDHPIQEPLLTIAYDPPPDDLSGITVLPNGMMAAFSGKQLYFCEPFKPHAWPEKYILTADYPIVGLGVFGSSVAIMTAGSPYVASGTAPENMVMTRLEVNLPCIAARGIVDLGYSVAYPSNDGIVMISTNGATLATGAILTRDQWRALTPASIVAGLFSGRYMASYVTYDGTTEVRGILILDATGEQPFLIRASDDVDAMFNDIGTGTLYVLKHGKDVYEWDALGQPRAEQTWRSKQFVLPGHTNFGCILVEGEKGPTTLPVTPEDPALVPGPPVADLSGSGAIDEQAVNLLPIGGSMIDAAPDDDPATFSATVYADGVAKVTIGTLNAVQRLPAGFLALTWEVEIRGSARVDTIAIAGSPLELATA